MSSKICTHILQSLSHPDELAHWRDLIKTSRGSKCLAVACLVVGIDIPPADSNFTGFRQDRVHFRVTGASMAASQVNAPVHRTEDTIKNIAAAWLQDDLSLKSQIDRIKQTGLSNICV